MIKTFKHLVMWLLPYAPYLHLRSFLGQKHINSVNENILRKNRVLLNRHSGSRCFIVGNGPSVLKQNLKSLKGQLVFTVSNGYLHSSFDDINPLYHCTPQISYEKMTEADVVAWLREMDSHIRNAEFIFNESEKDVIEKYGLFPNKTIHYLALRNSFDALDSTEIIDISKSIPAIESVPVMVIITAMYMGFSEIVLIGIDHDHFKTGVYNYAFKPKIQDGKDFSVTVNGEVTISRHDDFQSLARLWRQYRCLKNIAEANAIKIINASSGGELDEFPRVTLESAIRGDY